jgi:gluconate 5-dehydrogenase
VVHTWGKVDILVNNAGIVNPLQPAEKIKKETFDQVIDINLKGVFYATQIFGRQMIEQGQGRIISISSQVGLFGEKGFLPYAVSKNAVDIMMRSLAHEWSRYGVTLVSVAPGYIAGGMNEAVMRKEALVEYLSKRAPINRMGKVEELVTTVLFLASPEAQFINGETIVMDGGMPGYIQQPFLDMIMKGK